MKEREYRKLRDEIEKRYKADLDALERVWKLAQGGHAPGKRKATTRGNVTAAVREALGVVKSSRFTLRDVESWIRSNKPDLVDTSRTTISATLKRMVGREIEVLEQGSGKRATVYRKSERVAA